MNIYNQLHSIIIQIAKEQGIKDKNILDKITSEPPKEASHGDVSTNLALIGSKTLNKKPLDFASKIIKIISKHRFISNAVIAGPGFINLYLEDVILHKCCKYALEKKYYYGSNKIGKNQNINIEFVSANPTGPLHIGHARGAVLGDTLANILNFCGFKVTREYYINDAGEQVKSLARSVYKRYLEILTHKKFEYKNEVYPGEYLIPIAKNIIRKYNNKFVNEKETIWIEIFKKVSIDHIMNGIKKDLSVLGIKHDIFTSEESLIYSHSIKKVVSILKKKDLIYEGQLEAPKGQKKENWESRKQLLFKSSIFGDDLDRPLTKSDGTWTYFATDAAYHYEKCNRKFSTLINIWGADHAGYIKRIEGIIRAVSESNINFHVKLCQLVNFIKSGKQVKMSKREGNFISLSSVIDAVGPDVLRFIMLTRRNDVSLDFDVKKVTELSSENPVYYVQYAHARIRSLHRKAYLEGIKDVDFINDASYSLLKDPSEINLMKLIAKWPRIVELSAKSHEPHRIIYFLSDISASFHHLWSLGSNKPELRYIMVHDKDLTIARLSLAEAVRTVIATGLLLIGVKPLEVLE